jgi:hypothetical protein
LENLLLNPTLSDLVGGIQSVTLGDEEARKRGTQKTVLERKAPPTFDVIIEILEVDKLAIHHDVARVVDKLLRGQQPRPEIRVRNTVGEVEVVQRADPTDRASGERDNVYGRERGEYGRGGRDGEDAERGGYGRDGSAAGNGSGEPGGRRGLPATARLFPYGVSRSRLERAIAQMRVPATVSRDLSESDVVVALKATFRRDPGKLQEARAKNMPVYVVKSNTYIQIENVVRDLFGVQGGPAPTDEESALQEAEDAIENVLETGEPIELAPQNSYLRRLQHQMAEQANLLSESIGVEPKRRIRIARR